MSSFVHLHNHSDYSLLDGACRINDYIQKASEMGMKHVGLTDHGNMFGAMHFENACRSAGINPIIGSEVYVAPIDRMLKSSDAKNKSNHFVLYAKDQTGYQNLMKLTSMGYTEGFYYRPRIDDKLMERYNEGLMASSACLAGVIPRAILDGNMDKAREKALYYQKLFGKGNFWLEVMNHGIPEEEIVRKGIKQLHEETGIPIIATNDVHFISKEHANAHDVFICINTGKKQADTNRLKTETPEFYFKTEDEMKSLFSDFPDALENTVKLAERCDLKIPRPGPQLPFYQIPQDFKSPEDYLTHLTQQGLKERYPEILEQGSDCQEWKVLEQRIKIELNLICTMGYSGYFLIVWDFIDWSRKQNIPVGPGRGSAVGSLVAYCLKITDADPIKYDLLFERFLNPERVTMPDIDIDFCYERRSEVIEYIRNKYGSENVAGICTFGTLQTRAVLKDVARVMNIPLQESNQISKLIPYVFPDKSKVTVKNALDKIPELQEFANRGKVYQQLFDVAATLEGMNRHISTHACGHVIGQDNLMNYVPLVNDKESKEIITAYTMDIIEDCGLIKMDILGLKTLTLLKNCATMIRKKLPDFDLDKISETDEATFKMLGEGKSDAVFQFESPGMQKTLRYAKPSCIEDLVALNALYRPGPMDNIDQFVKSKFHPEKIKYPHPDLEQVLKPTYGVIVYQEQVMRVAQIIGGFSLGKADLLRRAMGKKKEKEMASMEVDFIAGARKKNYSEKLAKEVYEILKPFAGYGFNKSHAVAYSILAYQTAWCKANYPTEFWAANLTNQIDDPDKLKKYLESAKSEGITLMPPDINLSDEYFAVNGNQIVYGLHGIKGVGLAAAQAIIKAREKEDQFTDIMDFLMKVPQKTINRKTLEVCIKAGVFDSIEKKNRSTLLNNIDTILDVAQSRKKELDSGQGSLFGDSQAGGQSEIQWQEAQDMSKNEILANEKELLGFYVSGHIMDDYRELWESTVAIDLGNLEQATNNKQYTLLGMIKNVRKFQTRKGKDMATAEIEDFKGSIKIILFSNAYSNFGHLIEENTIVGVIGTLDMQTNENSIKVDKIKMPDELQNINIPQIHIELAYADYDEEQLVDIRSFFQENSGPASLYLHIMENGQKKIIKASPQISLAFDDESIEQIRQHHAVATAWKE